MSKPRNHFNSTSRKLWNGAARLALRPLAGFSTNQRFFILFSLLVFLTTLLLTDISRRGLADIYKEGDVVKTTVVAPADIAGILDPNETERRRAAAMQTARPVFDFDPSVVERAVESFRAAWLDLGSSTNGNPAKNPILVGPEGQALVDAIAAHRYSAVDLERSLRIIRETEDGYIYDESAAEFLRGDVLLVDKSGPGKSTVVLMPLNTMTALSAAQRAFRSRLSRLSGWSQEQQSALAAPTLSLIKANVSFDPAATEAARQAAADKVPAVTLSLKRNQVVAREGDTVTAPMLAELEAVRAYGPSRRPYHRFFGLLVIVAALFWAAWKFTEHRSATSALGLSKEKAFALVCSAVVVETVLMRLGFLVSDSIAAESARAPLNDPTIWNFAIPYAAAALLVAMLVDTQLALITALITALFAGLLAPVGPLKSFYVIVSCSAAIYGIGRYRERQSVTRAGLLVSGANALLAVALISYAQQPLTLSGVFLTLGCGVVGGLLTSIFTAGGLPINESVFGILTDVKLLELSNADLPVLGQLAIRAPGTNQHSHAVGQLAEEACRAVGANPLLARIGALYHDIGKLAAPKYFVENQHGDNPHDRLKPTQSAKIITSHVTYGVRLGKEIGLPWQIIDFIPQHHGTRTLHFFLRKAQAHAAEGESVNQADFRYPGPKPRFREAAIMMIADSCEAAARSLARPDPESITMIVTKIVDAIISDGQLDECDLTLRELTAVRESIITSLVAIYHTRIDYPGFNPPPLTGALPLPQADLDTEERGISYRQPSEVPINKSGEVEDEAVTRRP